MLKVKYQQELHIVKLSKLIIDLERTVKSIFKQLPLQFYFVHIDQDNDEIIINC